MHKYKIAQWLLIIAIIPYGIGLVYEAVSPKNNILTGLWFRIFLGILVIAKLAIDIFLCSLFYILFSFYFTSKTRRQRETGLLSTFSKRIFAWTMFLLALNVYDSIFFIGRNLYYVFSNFNYDNGALNVFNTFNEYIISHLIFFLTGSTLCYLFYKQGQG